MKTVIVVEPQECPKCHNEAEGRDPGGDFKCPSCLQDFCTRCFTSSRRSNGSLFLCPHCFEILSFPESVPQPEYDQIRAELDLTLDQKSRRVGALIVRAIKSGIHVDLLVRSAPGEVIAWDYWECLGYPKGTNDFVHVLPASLDSIKADHLRITFENVCGM